MPSIRKAPRNLIDVEHHTPERTRIRMNKKHGQKSARAMREKLAEAPGVEHVEYNERTGSFLVHHTSHPEMLGVLAGTTGDIATGLMELVIEAEEFEVAGLLMLAGMVLSGLARMAREHIKPPRDPGILHHTQKRTRIKVHEHHRTDEHLSPLKDKLQALPGVDRVNYNHRTGSVTIHHDGAHETLDDVGGTLRDFSSELFNCIAKHEDPRLAGVHLFAHAMTNGDSDDSLAKTAVMLVVLLMLSDSLAAA